MIGKVLLVIPAITAITNSRIVQLLVLSSCFLGLLPSCAAVGVSGISPASMCYLFEIGSMRVTPQDTAEGKCAL